MPFAWRTWRVRVLVVAFMPIACNAEERQAVQIETKVVVGDPTVVQLSASPNTVAALRSHTYRITPVVALSAEDLGTTAIYDARFRSDGSTAVLDRIGKEVVLFNQEGVVVRRFGRSGTGPGDFADPWALIPVGENFVVWQTSRSATFSAFDAEGRHTKTVGQPIGGDWRAPVFRRPFLFTDGVQHGPEDITRRLRAIDDNEFAHLILSDEGQAVEVAEGDSVSRTAYIVRYGLDLQVRDTLVALKASYVQRGETVPGAMPDYWEPLYSSRVMYAIGRDWIAVGHGDSASVSVYSLSDLEIVARITWPIEARRITDDEKEFAVDWTLEHAFVQQPEFEREWKRTDRHARQRAWEHQRDVFLRFADTAPNLTSLFAASDCLFLLGHNAEDYVNGAARTVLALNVLSGSAAAHTLPNLGEYLKDVNEHQYLVTYQDKNGEWSVRLYNHDFSCT